jgi:Outer membrane protein beta-barrel domain
VKKALIVLTVFLCVAAFAPRPAAASVDFGLKGGLSLSNITWSSGDVDATSLMKPVFGAFVAFNLGPVFAIQPEVYYWTGGAKSEDVFGEDVVEMQLKFNYIHVPLLAKLRFGSGSVKPMLFAGPAVSFLTTAKEVIYVNGVLEEDMDVKEFLKSTDVSAVIGTGLEFAMGKLLLILDARYNLGFANIDAKSSETTMKNKAWMFMLGVGF